MRREKLKSLVGKLRGLLDDTEQELDREPKRGGGATQFGSTIMECQIVARVSELRKLGFTFATIADMLNKEGYRTRQNGKWHIVGVQRIFVNQEKRAK